MVMFKNSQFLPFEKCKTGQNPTCISSSNNCICCSEILVKRTGIDDFCLDLRRSCNSKILHFIHLISPHEFSGHARPTEAIPVKNHPADCLKSASGPVGKTTFESYHGSIGKVECL